MGFERTLELARTLSREEFARSFASWFLIILDTGEEEPPSSFETMDVSAPRAIPAAKPAAPLVHEIVKAEGNPYPDRISLGRARNCDVVLRHASVSKLHAHFLPGPDGQLEIADVGSQVGTRVNGNALPPNRPQRVAPGTVLSIGHVIAKVTDAAAAWDVLDAQEDLDEGSAGASKSSLPPPRYTMPMPMPAPRRSVPPLRSTSPGPAAQGPVGERSSAERSGIRRAEPDEPGLSGSRPGFTRRG